MKFCILAIALLAAIVLLSGCIDSTTDETIKIGFQKTQETALVQVAAEKGFFKEQGLDVELVEFTAGKLALQAFLAGDVDIALPGDVPVALAKLQGNDFYVLTQIAECPGENPVLALDEGIADPKEYFMKSKRKLTTSIGGTPEYYTYNFLKYYGIPQGQVEIIAQKPEEMVAAFTTGSVDAMSVFEPYPTMAEEMLPGKTLRFEIPEEVYSPTYVLVANKAWVDSSPEKARNLLKALIQAEEFIKNNPQESQKIVAKITKFSEQIVEKIWSTCKIKAEISDRLVETWKDESRWAIESGKAKETPMPDYEKILRKDLLESARGLDAQ